MELAIYVMSGVFAGASVLYWLTTLPLRQRGGNPITRPVAKPIPKPTSKPKSKQ